MLPVEGKQVKIGKAAETPFFGWDCEYGFRYMDVPSFAASEHMVTNGEFYQFVADGGYARKEFWSKEGWGWRAFRNAKWPTFWRRSGPQGYHHYRLRIMHDEVDMPWNWPVDANYHEAKAYANWLSAKQGLTGEAQQLRITTEAEHNLMREDGGAAPACELPRDEMASKQNLNFCYASQQPVDALPANGKGFRDLMGNAWEWCEDNFNALPGFEPHRYYDDFAMPCFDGEHNIIMGGSFISTGNEATATARFHFRPHFFQHAGFRVVKPNAEKPLPQTTCMDNQGPYVTKTSPFRTNPYTSATASAVPASQAAEAAVAPPSAQQLEAKKHAQIAAKVYLESMEPLLREIREMRSQMSQMASQIEELSEGAKKQSAK